MWLPVRDVGALLGILGGVDVETLVAVFDLVPCHLQKMLAADEGRRDTKIDQRYPGVEMPRMIAYYATT